MQQSFPGIPTLKDQAAEREAVIRDSRDKRLWHYSGHALSDFENPLSSYLRLSGLSLTLQDIFTEIQMPHCFLAIANGCQTAMAKPQPGDDHVSFASGLLYAGAQRVISTLWSVFDISAALLMVKFYENWHTQHQQVSTAMRNAQRWLREMPNGQQLFIELETVLQGAPPEKRAECLAAALPWKDRETPPFASPIHWAPHTLSSTVSLFKNIR